MPGNWTWGRKSLDIIPEQYFSRFRTIAPDCVSLYGVAYSNVTLMALTFVILPFVYTITRFIAEDIKHSFLNLMNQMLTEI
jgi:hypothetical protein